MNAFLFGYTQGNKVIDIVKWNQNDNEVYPLHMLLKFQFKATRDFTGRMYLLNFLVLEYQPPCIAIMLSALFCVHNHIYGPKTNDDGFT